MPLTLCTKRKFPTEHVLCVVTKCIPESTMLPGVYKLLEHMTGGEVSTPNLSRAMNEAHRFLLYRHSQLWKDAPIGQPTEIVQRWFDEKLEQLGDSLEVGRN